MARFAQEMDRIRREAAAAKEKQNKKAPKKSDMEIQMDRMRLDRKHAERIRTARR